MRSPASMRSAAFLRALAAAKGYEVEKAAMHGCWRIVGADGLPMRNPNGAASFTIEEAVAFLKAQPDA